MTQRQYALMNVTTGRLSPFKPLRFDTVADAEAYRDGTIARHMPEHARLLSPVEVSVEKRSGDSTVYTMGGHTSTARRVRATQRVETHWAVEVDDVPLSVIFYVRKEAEARSRAGLAHAVDQG